MPTTKYKRVLLKLSGEVFQNKETGHNLDASVLENVAKQLIEVKELGFEISLVCGGGNIFRGLAGQEAGISRSQGDYMGMLATVINALALQSALEAQGMQTRVMTAIPMPNVAEPFIRRRAMRHLEKGRVVIFGAGTGNPYFTTDSAAALRASEIEVDLLAKGTKVDGVYTADPMKDPTATKYDQVSYDEAIQKDLRIMDTAAFSLCKENKIPIVVFNFFKDHEMKRVLTGQNVGTLIKED
jgi:uridylate kinase